MNYEKEGFDVAKIINKDNANKDKTIYVEPDKTKVNEYITEITLTNPVERIQQIPSKKRERSILYITGASGSGKSYYTMMYVKEYKKIFPKNQIYLFSALDSDDTLDKIKEIKRVKLDQKFYDTVFEINDFKDSLIIFDDTDCINDKLLKQKLSEILDMLLQTGRHSKSSVIFTSHLPNNGLQTRMILAECHSITIFLATLGGRSLKYLLDGYLGLDKHQIKKIKDIGILNSRWITIVKSYPMVVLYEKGAFTFIK